MNKDFLKNPPKKYRPAPFWSWNEKLSPEETATQVELMEKAGLVKNPKYQQVDYIASMKEQQAAAEETSADAE